MRWKDFFLAVYLLVVLLWAVSFNIRLNVAKSQLNDCLLTTVPPAAHD